MEERSEEAEGPQSSRIVRGDEGPAPDAATRGEVGGESPTVVVVGRVDVSLRHHHERLLRASASSAVDAVAAEEGAFAIFEAHASRGELAARDVVRTAPGDGYGEVLRRRLDHALYCRYDEVLAATVVDQLVAALRVVEAKVDLFVRDYGSVVRELGALVAYDFVKAMDDDYRQSGGDSIWRKFLGLLTRRGVVVALLNEVLVPEEVGGHARRPTYRGDAAYLLRLEEVVLQDVRRPAEWRQAARAAVRELAQRLVDADAKGCDEQEGGP